MIQARRCVEQGMIRGNGSWANALSQTRQVILLGIEHGLWRGLPGLLRNAERCSDDGVMIDGWQAQETLIVLFPRLSLLCSGGLTVVSKMEPSTGLDGWMQCNNDQRHFTAHFSPDHLRYTIHMHHATLRQHVCSM